MRLGIDFGGTNLKTGLYNEDGSLVDFQQTALAQFLDSRDMLGELVDYARERCRGHTITHAGIAIKGLVNTHTGVLEDDIGEGAALAGKNLRKAFGEGLGVPFAVDNDARGYALGEYKFGAGRGTKVMACLTLGTGVGGALIYHGKPFEGANILGGIVGGHLTIDRNGIECPCGNRGCLEQYCSATAFTKRVRDAHPELKDVVAPLPAFFNDLSQPGRQETLDAFLDDLAAGVVNAVNAYGPDMVVIGGGVMASSDKILPGLTERVHRRAWTFPRGNVRIAAAELGSQSATLGAAFHPDHD